MKTRPKKLRLMAGFFLSIGLSLPIQIMILYGNTPLEVRAIFAKLAPLNLLIMVLAPLAAISVYRASVLTFAIVPALVAAVLKNNWLVAEIGTNYSPVLVGLSSGLFLATTLSLMTRETRVLFSNPEKRWWLTPQRHQMARMARIRMQKDRFLKTFDISEGGAFLTIDGKGDDLDIGTTMPMSLILDKGFAIQCKAEVVRKTPATGHYPKGIGVRFTDLSILQRWLLLQYLEGHHEHHEAAATGGGQPPAQAA
jgi:hypothetical protein